MSELVWRSIGELARAIAGREVSPVEVVQAHLDRVAALDGKLRAFITVSADAALAAAKAAEAAVMAGERLTVFAHPAHGTLTHKSYDPQRKGWTDWIHLDEQPRPDAAVPR